MATSVGKEEPKALNPWILPQTRRPPYVLLRQFWTSFAEANRHRLVYDNMIKVTVGPEGAEKPHSRFITGCSAIIATTSTICSTADSTAILRKAGPKFRTCTYRIVWPVYHCCYHAVSSLKEVTVLL